jgi:hypothetical protein
MKITIETTDVIDTAQGGPVRARIWKGETDSGVPVKAWVCIVQPQTHDAEALAQFERELREVEASRELVSFDMRMVI